MKQRRFMAVSLAAIVFAFAILAGCGGGETEAREHIGDAISYLPSIQEKSKQLAEAENILSEEIASGKVDTEEKLSASMVEIESLADSYKKTLSRIDDDLAEVRDGGDYEKIASKWSEANNAEADRIDLSVSFVKNLFDAHTTPVGQLSPEAEEALDKEVEKLFELRDEFNRRMTEVVSMLKEKGFFETESE